ncbi:MAG: hypothetical protein HY043_13770 [Verrucomicrobia bacterium]|nr:hypothetical protein [Verrucomicrobiota bacterium]
MFSSFTSFFLLHWQDAKTALAKNNCEFRPAFISAQQLKMGSARVLRAAAGVTPSASCLRLTNQVLTCQFQTLWYPIASTREKRRRASINQIVHALIKSNDKTGGQNRRTKQEDKTGGQNRRTKQEDKTGGQNRRTKQEDKTP